MEGLKDKKTWIKTVYLTAAAFLLVAFASRSSFLYPCNDWNDANSYFSVGKALFNGKVPYRDVFDQKGMYLYFFYGLAYLVSHTTFRGVFLLEGLLALVDLLAIYHVLRLYTKNNTALVLAPLPLAAVFSSQSFYWGGSAEEICLPFLLWGLYLFLRYFNDYPHREMKGSTLFAAGLLAGMVANIKFTSLGFFFAWMMWTALALFTEKSLGKALKACGIFLGGMALPFLPWLIYFAVQGDLYYWYWGYVYINVFAYSNLNGEGPGLWERVYTLSKLLYWVVLKNINYFIFLIPGVLFTFFGKRKKLIQRLSVPVLCFFLFLGIYVGGSELPYYALPLGVFTVLGFALMGWCWDRAVYGMIGGQESIGRKRAAGSAAKLIAGCVLSVMAGVMFIFHTSMNTEFMKVKREEHYLYQFQPIVNQEQNPTLLNIGCLDAGLYTVCDIVPTCQWFQTQTVIMDTVLSEQERYIKEGLITFVIARDSYPEVIWDKYELVAQVPWQQGELEFIYYLFRRKS